MYQIFYRPVIPKCEAPRVGGLPCLLENCRGGPGPTSLSIKKTQNLLNVSIHVVTLNIFRTMVTPYF